MEQVILVDEHNQQIGLADKAEVHTKNTPLHRAFSLFLFNSQGELLLTQRALTKKTFAGVWTNTVCGHLGPGETEILAAQRRLKEELGIICHSEALAEESQTRSFTAFRMTQVSDYRYRFTDKNGIVENEICPILVGYYDGEVKPNPLEVENYKWVKWENWLLEIKENPQNWSPWCVEETKILESMI